MAYKDLNDKVFLVTGSTSGIGEAIVVRCSALGAKVVITGRDEEEARRVSAECERVSPLKLKNLVHIGDMTNDEDVKQLLEKTINYFGRIDVLVNNAGGLKLGNILDDKFMSDYDYTMNLNVRSVVLLSRLALPYLIETEGSLINISSIASHRYFQNILSYSMAKAAIDNFTKHLAAEFGPKGVRANAINPGIVKTKVHQRAGFPDTIYEEEPKAYPLKRYAMPEEVAESVCFLASEKSSFVTGITLPFDGGFNCI